MHKLPTSSSIGWRVLFYVSLIWGGVLCSFPLGQVVLWGLDVLERNGSLPPQVPWFSFLSFLAGILGYFLLAMAAALLVVLLVLSAVILVGLKMFCSYALTPVPENPKAEILRRVWLINAIALIVICFSLALAPLGAVILNQFITPPLPPLCWVSFLLGLLLSLVLFLVAAGLVWLVTHVTPSTDYTNLP